MPDSPLMTLSAILSKAADGDEHARAEVVRVAYDDLRQIAATHMARQRPGHTLTSTALVNEVAVKLLADENLPTESRAHFLAYAARARRNLLIDHARSKGRQKRGGGRAKLTLMEAFTAAEQQSEDFLALNDALDDLAALRPRQAQVVEMRYFGGLKLDEIAQSLGISIATVKRDWEIARTLLLASLTQPEKGE
ncbi:MAG: ECF-type sigma factor [Planctomycetota bacterium]